MTHVMLDSGGRRARRAQILLAFDRSLRSIDADGHMRVEESRISKANVCPYFGREIPDSERLGLDPNRTYRLFRDPKELEKGASTFDGKPLLITHVAVSAELPRKELWVGTLGRCTFEAPFLMTRPLMVLTKEAIDLIESEEQRELSAAYRYEAIMEPGAWGGMQYDGRMVNIQGNHVAIVSQGRAGSDVHVADELPPELRRMSRLTLAASLAAVIGPLLKDEDKATKHRVALALDGALGETPAESVISLDAAEMAKACDEALEEKRKEHGADAELTDEEKEKAFERARDKKAKDKKARDKKAADKKAADKAAADKAAKDKARDEEDPEKRGEDADPDHRKDFDPIKARDELRTEMRQELERESKASRESLAKQFRDAAEAREVVRPLVGVVSMAMDSAEDIYRFALKSEKVKCEGITEAAALRALVDMAVERKGRVAGPRRDALAMDANVATLTDPDSLFGSQKDAA